MGEPERFLVSAASTALGAWVVKLLIGQGVEVAVLGDLADDHRLRLIAEPSELLALRKIAADVDDVDSVHAAMADATHVIHLDAVTDEDCARDPRRAASESVLRTAAVFESARRCGITGLAFESSMSVHAEAGAHVGREGLVGPLSLRGAFNQAKEVMAREYDSRHSLPSIAVRPSLVYGPGVDTGRAASTTTAIAAAVVKCPYRVAHGGIVEFQFVVDVAADFIGAARASADRVRAVGAAIDLAGHRESVSGFLTTLGLITGADEFDASEQPLTMLQRANDATDGRGVEMTELEDGIRQTVETFRWAPRDLYWNETGVPGE